MTENIWRVYIDDLTPAGEETNNTYQLIEQEAEPTVSIAGSTIDTTKTALVIQRKETTDIVDITTGTWTPTIGNGSVDFTTSIQTGEYMRIGNHVFAYVYLLWSARNSTSGIFTRVSLPFSVSSFGSGVNFGRLDGVTAGDGNILIVGQPEINYVRFRAISSTTGNETPDLLNTNFQESGLMTFSLNYITS